MRRHVFPTLPVALVNRMAWIILGLLFLVAASARADSGLTPKYVFFFIGDGLAMPQRAAAEYVLPPARDRTSPASSSWP